MNEPAIEVKDVHVRYRSMKSFSLRKSLGQIRQRRDSYEALRGVKHAIVHLYNPTSFAQRQQVFRMSEDEIVDIAVSGAKLFDE